MVGNNRDEVVTDPGLVLAKGFNDRVRLFFTRRPFFLSWRQSFGPKGHGKMFLGLGVILL